MQLPFQFECYDCGVDRAEKCVDKFNCEILYALSSKALTGCNSKSTFIVMLKKRLFDKYAINKDIGLIISQYKQQLQQPTRTTSNNSLYNRMQPSNLQMDQNMNISANITSKIHSHDQGIGSNGSSISNSNGRHHFSQSIIPSNLAWNDSIKIDHTSNHSNHCYKHSMKTHRNDHSAVAATMHHQPCNLFSTKLTIENRTITSAAIVAAHGSNAMGRACDHTFDNTTSKQNANKSNDSEPNSSSSRASLKPMRSSLQIVHRSNLLKIFIKYLLILNCFVCIANGNLMSRTIGNDLSSKHNQTNVETGTAHPLFNGSSTAMGNARKGMLTTASPLILHSIMSNNRSHFHNVQQSQEDGRAKHFLHQHAENPFRMPNGEEFTRCASCEQREAQNLEWIKIHILSRLQMKLPPNITGRPHISEKILDTFYENNDSRYIRLRNHEDDNDDMNEMQGDDSNAANNKHQHHHLHEYHRNAGIKTGLHEQHHHHQSSHHHYNRRPSRLEENDELEFEEKDDYGYSDREGAVYNMDYYNDVPYDDVEETNEAFFSTTDLIYSFPKLSKARHRGDILEFTVNISNHLTVSNATFYLFIRGEDWLAENEPNSWMRSGGNAKTNSMHPDESAAASGTSTVTTRDEHSYTSSDSFHKLHDNGKNVNNNHISISINRFVHRHQQQQNTNDQEQSKKSAQPTQQQQQQRYTRIDSNFVGEIPKGAGKYIKFNITLMVSEWIQQQQQKHQSVNTQSADIVQEVVIKTLEPWMRQLLVLDTNSKNPPYIEIQTRDMRKHRTKRHLAKDCRENERQSRCCRYPLRVDFRKFGWDWIIAPDIYEAYYCAGECPIGFLPKHPHTYIYSLSSSFSTCCSPRKLSPLSLLYFDDNKNVIHSIIPNMAVEKCGCS